MALLERESRPARTPVRGCKAPPRNMEKGLMSAQDRIRRINQEVQGLAAMMAITDSEPALGVQLRAAGAKQTFDVIVVGDGWAGAVRRELGPRKCH